MEIIKLNEDEYGWTLQFKYRKGSNDFIVERKSRKYPKFNKSMYFKIEELERLLAFANKVLVNEEVIE